MNQQNIRFIIGVLAHYVMNTDSVSSKRKAIQIMHDLNKELTHE